jgi:hypothetical protein
MGRKSGAKISQKGQLHIIWPAIQDCNCSLPNIKQVGYTMTYSKSVQITGSIHHNKMIILLSEEKQ